MKRIRIRTCVLLLMLGALLAGCGEDPGGTSVVIALTTATPQGTPPIDLDLLEYETISGTLYPGQSGVMYKNLKSWPANCLFGLVVPETSMPGGGPINFTMSIPTKASYLEYPEETQDWLIIRLAPDGEQFTGPITVAGTWMPWMGTGRQQGVPPDPLYYWNGTEWGVATVTYVANYDRYRITFQVDHFSDWETGPEPPNPPPPPPGG